jgi:hypothetical protein
MVRVQDYYDQPTEESKPISSEARRKKERQLGIKTVAATIVLAAGLIAGIYWGNKLDEQKHFANGETDALSNAIVQIYKGEVDNGTFEAIDQHGLLRYEGAVEVSGNIRTDHDVEDDPSNLVRTISKDESIILDSPLVVRTKDNGDWVLFVMLNNDGEPFAVYANEQGIKNYDPFKASLLKDASKEIPDALAIEPVLPTPQS